MISLEPQPQPPSTRAVPLQAEEAPSMVAETRTPTTSPPPAPAAAVEEGEAATEATVTQAALEASSGAGPSVEGVVVVLEEDVVPPLVSERHDAAVVLALESAQVPAVTSHLPAVEVPVPPPTMEVQGPPSTAKAVESSSARVSLTVEEMMDLETCRYIDLPGVGVIDLEAPQLPEKEYDAATERRSNEPTIASVSKALQEYECASGFTLAAAEDAEDVALAAPAALVEPTEDASAPPHVDEGKEASPPRPVEAAETLAPARSLSRRRSLLGKRRRHRPVQSPLKLRVSRLVHLTSWPLLCKGWPSPRRWPGPSPQRSRWLRRRGRPFPKARRAAVPGRLSSRVLRGRLPPGLTLTLRMTRRPRRATPWSMGLPGRAGPLTSSSSPRPR
jgi:hypothetical protein